jgi:hypothetical protein
MNLIERNPARRIPVTKPEKSRIDLGHYVMGSGQLGWLMPIGHYEIVPGDSLQLKSNVRIDYAPVLRPFMTRIDTYIHHHWVPMRLIMPRIGITNTDWESFIQGDPESIFNNDIVPHTTIDTTDVQAGCYDVDSLNSYFGLPIIDDTETVASAVEINLLKQIAYWLVVDEYYRNEWLLERICGPTSNWTVTLEGGDRQGVTGQAIMAEEPFNVFQEMDYFGGATPNAYKGSDSDVELDLDIIGNTKNTAYLQLVDGTNQTTPAAGNPVFAGGTNLIAEPGPGGNLGFKEGTYQSITAELEIMELRRTQALTRFLEAENRLGTDDYEDWLLSIFGVQNPDFRDKSPRYLGGGKIQTNVNSVVNPGDVLTPSTDAVNVPAGFKAGLAGVQGSTNQVYLNATEFGIVLTLMSLVPRQSYGNRLDRFFLKGATGDRTDFFNPYFQNIGDQEIYNCERGFDLDDTGGAGANLDTWGYQQRWAEYKYYPSYVTGEFAVDAGSGGLDDFHMARLHHITSAAPTLSQQNMQIVYDEDQNIRIFQSQGTEHHLYYTVYNDAQFVRPMYLTDIPV